MAIHPTHWAFSISWRSFMGGFEGGRTLSPDCATPYPSKACRIRHDFQTALHGAEDIRSIP
jgi:hypothetical protein